MSIFISNFGRRIADYIIQNRARLLRLALIVAAALLIVIGIEQIQRWRYERRVQALESQRSAAELKAKQAEDRARAADLAIAAKEGELRELESLANAADAALKNARAKTVTLKEAYETVRLVPVPFTPISCPDACVELAAIGYPCK